MNICMDLVSRWLQTITYVLTTAKLDATGHRWVAALSNYNVSLTYRSGKLNTAADGLSRLAENNDTQHIVYPDVPKDVLNACQVDCTEPPLAESTLITQS